METIENNATYTSQELFLPNAKEFTTDFALDQGPVHIYSNPDATEIFERWLLNNGIPPNIYWEAWHVQPLYIPNDV